MSPWPKLIGDARRNPDAEADPVSKGHQAKDTRAVLPVSQSIVPLIVKTT